MRKKESSKPKVNKEVKREFGLLVIDNKYYYGDMIDGKIVYREISKAKVQKRLKLIDEIVKKLKDSLDREAVLKETLMKNFPMGDETIEEELLKLLGMLKSKERKYKPKTRVHHCVDMKVGGMIIPIVD